MASKKAGGKLLSLSTSLCYEVKFVYPFYFSFVYMFIYVYMKILSISLLFLFFWFLGYYVLPLEQALAAEFPRDFLGISLPEQPNKYYFIIRGQRLVLEADSSIQTIMEKLQSYKSKVSLNFEVCLCQSHCNLSSS